MATSTLSRETVAPAVAEEEYRYWAFISYSHQDEAWARWLHGALETYRVPRRLVGRVTRGGTGGVGTAGGCGLGDAPRRRRPQGQARRWRRRRISSAMTSTTPATPAAGAA